MYATFCGGEAFYYQTCSAWAHFYRGLTHWRWPRCRRVHIAHTPPAVGCTPAARRLSDADMSRGLAAPTVNTRPLTAAVASSHRRAVVADAGSHSGRDGPTMTSANATVVGPTPNDRCSC